MTPTKNIFQEKTFQSCCISLKRIYDEFQDKIQILELLFLRSTLCHVVRIAYCALNASDIQHEYKMAFKTLFTA